MSYITKVYLTATKWMCTNGGSIEVQSGGNLTIDSGGTFNYSAANMNQIGGDFAVNTSMFTVAHTTGNTVAAGTLTSTGNFTVGTGYTGTGATLTSAGALSIKGALQVDGTSTLAGAVTFGNGYSGTGATMTAAGALSTKGAVVIDTTLGVTGLTTLNGGGSNPSLKMTGAGSIGGTTAGTVWSSGAPSLVSAQLYARIYIGSVVYRIPVWADA